MLTGFWPWWLASNSIYRLRQIVDWNGFFVVAGRISGTGLLVLHCRTGNNAIQSTKRSNAKLNAHRVICEWCSRVSICPGTGWYARVSLIPSQWNSLPSPTILVTHVLVVKHFTEELIYIPIKALHSWNLSVAVFSVILKFPSYNLYWLFMITILHPFMLSLLTIPEGLGISYLFYA